MLLEYFEVRRVLLWGHELVMLFRHLRQWHRLSVDCKGPIRTIRMVVGRSDLPITSGSSLGGASAVSQAVPLPPIPAAFAQGAMPSPLPESLVNFPIAPGQVVEVPQRNRVSLIESIMGMPSPAFTTSSKRTNLSHGTFGSKGGARF